MRGGRFANNELMKNFRTDGANENGGVIQVGVSADKPCPDMTEGICLNEIITQPCYLFGDSNFAGFLID